jgi:hypothetical protein
LKIIAAGHAPHTASGALYDPFSRGNSDGGGGDGKGARDHQPHKSLSELKHSRKMAMRADPSFDLDGDGTVSQKDFFFASE